MLTKVRKTFDWDYVVRCLTAGSVLYVVTAAALRGAAGGGAMLP